MRSSDFGEKSARNSHGIGGFKETWGAKDRDQHGRGAKDRDQHGRGAKDRDQHGRGAKGTK